MKEKPDKSTRAGDEAWVRVKREKLEKALHKLKDSGVDRISCITGTDTGKTIDVTYHLLHDGKPVNIRVSLPRKKPQIRTIISIYPGAALFERELSEMLGIKIEGHPDPRKLFLPEDWKGRPPYRK